jgi:NADH-quinone oxidoreductase subunit D
MPEGLAERANRTFDWFEKRIEEYEKVWLNNPVFEQRTRGVGVLSRGDAVRFGATGTVLRASGVKHDIRKAEPYSAYPEFDFEVPVSQDGDCWARAWVAVEELKQSMRILRQAFKNIPPGPVRVKLGPQPRVPAGESYFRTEAAHGERSYHLVSDGSPRPYRLKMGDPNFRNMIIIRELLRGVHVADIPLVYWGTNYWPVSCDR